MMNITDHEIRQLIQTNFNKGWEALYRKYNTSSYRVKIGAGYRANYALDEIEIAWSDAIYAACQAVVRGKFVPKNDDLDFVLPFIIRVAQFILNKRRGKHMPIGPDYPDDPPVVHNYMDDADMLVLHTAAYQLRDLYRDIILLKYFADSEEKFGLTDDEIANILAKLGYPFLNRHEMGVNRRRAIYQLMKTCQKHIKDNIEKHTDDEAALTKPSYPMHDDRFKRLFAQLMKIYKRHIEEKVQEQIDSDFALINVHYPIVTLRKLFNEGNNSSKEQRRNSVLDFLGKLRSGEGYKKEHRIRIYPSMAADFMNHLYPKATKWSSSSIVGKIKELLNSFGKKIEPRNHENINNEYGT
jgi:hypothetical protein